MRKFRLRRQKKIVPLQRKIERRERRREEKALIAAKLENAIEKQLVERLKKGMVTLDFIFVIKMSYVFVEIFIFLIFQYEGIYNFPQRAFDKAVGAVEVEGESEAENEQEELEKEVEFEADERETEQDGLEYVEADSDDDFEDDEDDIEELSMVSSKTITY